jgi:hypothetical protein
LFKRRYGMEGTKDDYKRLVLTAGTPMHYDGDKSRAMHRADVKAYLKVDSCEVWIDVQDRCVCNGSVIEVNVVDIHCSWACLYVLTREHLSTFIVTKEGLRRQGRYPLTRCKRIVPKTMTVLFEMEDGRLLHLRLTDLTGHSWIDATYMYSRTFNGKEIGGEHVVDYAVGKSAYITDDHLYFVGRVVSQVGILGNELLPISGSRLLAIDLHSYDVSVVCEAAAIRALHVQENGAYFVVCQLE